MKTAHLIFIAAVAAALPLFAWEPATLAAVPEVMKAPGAEYRIECRMVTVPGRLVPALVAELDDEEKAVAAVHRLEAMIERGEATLTDFLLARGFEQQPIRTESTGEMKAVAGFDEPDLPRPLEHRLDFRHGRPVRDRLVDAGPLATGDRLSFSLTDFLDLHTQAWLLLAPGRPKLVDVHRLPGTPTAFELVLLTVTAPPGAPAATRRDNEPRWTVRAEVQMLALPQTKARALMPGLREPTTFPAAHAQLPEMLAAGEAELLGAPRAEGFCRRFGDPAIGASASSEEIRYASEFTPPQLPHIFITDIQPKIPLDRALHAPTALDDFLSAARLRPTCSPTSLTYAPPPPPPAPFPPHWRLRPRPGAQRGEAAGRRRAPEHRGGVARQSGPASGRQRADGLGRARSEKGTRKAGCGKTACPV